MPTTEDFTAGLSANGRCVVWGVPFAELYQYYRASAEHLKSRGIAGKDLAREIRSSFRAMCPRCNYWITATTIGSLSVIMEEGREHAHFTQYGPLCRMLDGHCPRGDCIQEDAGIIWGGEPGIVEGVQNLFERALKDMPPEEALRRYRRPDVVGFVSDNVFLRRECLTGQILDGEDGDDQVVVWVTLAKGELDANWIRANLYPNGYIEFFNGLLSHPKYDRGKALMHWTCVVAPDGRWILHLMFLDKKRDPSLPGAVLFPIDILTEEEKAKASRTKAST